MPNSRGFTLIELMVTIGIAAILIAVALPSMTEFTARRSLEGVANELSADLHYAKSQAASSNSDISLVTTVHGYTIGSTTNTLKTITLDTAISLTDAVTATFDPYRSLPGANASITITHSKISASLRVEVKVTTDALGIIRVCSPGASFGGYITC